jgi:predicted kinase
MELVIFIGIQASGKTTFYKDYFINTHLRISLDVLRTRYREKTIYECCLMTKTRIVIDNTNPQKNDRERYITSAKVSGYEISGYYFAIDRQIAIERNAKRTCRDLVPIAGLISTSRKMELPSYDEGFDKLYYISSDGADNFRIEDWKCRTVQ